MANFWALAIVATVFSVGSFAQPTQITAPAAATQSQTEAQKVLPPVAKLAAQCLPGKVKVIVENKATNLAMELCYDNIRKYYVSKDCHQLTCTLLSLNRKFTMSDLYREHANPQFTLCRSIGGIPYFSSIKTSNFDWREVSLCFNPKMNEFVDLETLYKRYVLPAPSVFEDTQGASKE